MENKMSVPRRKMLQLLTVAFGSALTSSRFGFAQQSATPPKNSPPPAPAATTPTPAATPDMPAEKVTGIGGFFFRSPNHKALALWYQQHLGISVIPMKLGDKPWLQEAGPTAFAPFSETTSYFDVSKPFMINFRVRDLDKMAAQLKAAGIEIKIDPETYPNGRFAHLHDPDGNPIELWQPMDHS
jgi:glyoxylase I family protein